MGILQITGLSENPRGVKLRYKLVQNVKNKTPASPNSAFEPADVREAHAKLAAARVKYAEQNPAFQRALARVNELERLTKVEPGLPANLREAKARLAELRVDYAEQHPRIQEAIAKVKALEQK